MKILLCCEFFHPSVGGVQEVMKQIGLRFVLAGHEVSVATSFLEERKVDVYQGINILEFRVSGNLVNGLEGPDISKYQELIVSDEYDVILIKAAQQWTFDAVWPVIDSVTAGLVLIPCGFSGLYLSDYGAYYNDLKEILPKFDHLIFYAENYRDINFARSIGISDFTVIPNGADEREFLPSSEDGDFKSADIAGFDRIFLSVGSPPIQKGMREVAKAFRRADLRGHSAILILNSDWTQADKNETSVPSFDNRGILYIGRYLYSKFRATASMIYHSGPIKGMKFFRTFVGEFFNGAASPDTIGRSKYLSEKRGDRKILTLNLDRKELVKLYKKADLFLFASQIEYSPLVIFEAIASNTRFLSADVGNVNEIVSRTGAGSLVCTKRDRHGYSRVSVKSLAQAISEEIVHDKPEVVDVSATTPVFWSQIAPLYLEVLKGAAK